MSSPQIARFSWGHGVGDLSHALHLFELWRRRGHKLLIHASAGRDWAFKACGFQLVDSASTQHIFPEPQPANRDRLHEPWDGSKAGRNLNPTGFSPLPYIGHPGELWDELIQVRHDLGPHVGDEAKKKVDAILEGLPRPIVLTHTRGITSPHLKNFPADVEADTIHALLDLGGSVVAADWEGTGVRLVSGRFKAARVFDLETLYWLIRSVDCVVGCDSGVFHYARLTRTPRVGCFWGIPAWHCVLPSDETVSLVAANGNNPYKRFDFGLVEVPKITGLEVARVVGQVLGPRRYCDRIGPDVVLQNLLPHLRHRNSNLTTVVDRGESYGLVFEFLKGRSSPRVIETGCCRSIDDWGAGWSTPIWGYLLKQVGGHLTSVDLSDANTQFARKWTQRLPVDVVRSDSVEYLRGASGEYDCIFLDSMDTDCPDHADHCLAEARIAVDLVAQDGLIVIDDTVNVGGAWTGKGEKAVPWLLANGWRHVWDGYQQVLRRAG